MYKDLPVPHNEEAEMAVLGSCFIDFEALAKIKDMLTPQDFWAEKHQWVYSAMVKLHNRREPTNQVIVAYELEKMGKLQAVGGAAFISHCVAQTPTSVHVVYYAKIVKECSDRRSQIAKGEQIKQDAFEGKPSKKHSRIEL